MLKKIVWGLMATLMVVVAVLTAAYYTFQPRQGWEKSGSELTALAAALYWESALAESQEGMRAIAHVILNRTSSKDFPRTIREVVTAGVQPGRRSGCQFSFACDGEVEEPGRLCELHPRDTASLGFAFCERRWAHALLLAAWWLYVSPGEDPTGGAVLYYTGPDPYWAGDLVEGSVRKIGSHTFGRSKYIGRDVALQ